MDALFVPLAQATGASLDQIKVCALTVRRGRLTEHVGIAHNMFVSLISTGKRVYSHTR